MTFENNTKSVISVINQFLSSVDEMDSTVLVPRRLMDKPACQLQSTNLEAERKINENNDLFKFYTMLLDTRNEILWGGKASESQNDCPIVEQLQQFSRTLVNLTDLATQLKDRYEHDVRNGTGSGRNSPAT